MTSVRSITISFVNECLPDMFPYVQGRCEFNGGMAPRVCVSPAAALDLDFGSTFRRGGFDKAYDMLDLMAVDLAAIGVDTGPVTTRKAIRQAKDSLQAQSASLLVSVTNKQRRLMEIRKLAATDG